MNQFDGASLIAALDALVLEIRPEGITMLEPEPSWLVRFAGHDPNEKALGELFPFLEIFLDGDEAWEDGPGSEVWTQRDLLHEEQVLEVSPLRVENRKLLLLRRAGREYDRRRGELQMARDHGLAGERLTARAREIERINQLKSAFLASMNHELRTPLNAIGGFSSLLIQGRGGTLSAEQLGFAREIRTASDHLVELINEALDIARIEAGQIVLSKEPIAVAEMLREVAAAVGPLAEEKRIAIETRCEDELLVLMDRRRFRQMLYNLLSNGIKFTPPDGRIRVSGIASGNHVRISVSANGIGIPNSEHRLIFEPFYQGSDAALRGGTGLGLAITQRLVKEHGGAISVESEPGRGSTFTLELPSPVSGG